MLNPAHKGLKAFLSRLKFVLNSQKHILTYLITKTLMGSNKFMWHPRFQKLIHSVDHSMCSKWHEKWNLNYKFSDESEVKASQLISHISSWNLKLFVSVILTIIWTNKWFNPTLNDVPWKWKFVSLKLYCLCACSV